MGMEGECGMGNENNGNVSSNGQFQWGMDGNGEWTMLMGMGMSSF